uniref:phage tail protein I n=1 Tax=Candidatus Vondammii sp. HM_W22 TaxID=2687299 RepID=UPI001F147E5A|nr:phage tail protein I [Candidatus Vondammii sp. HM_W22]
MNSLLPPNASALERATEGAINDSIESIPVPVRDLWNPERCPAALLSWLAWALSVDNWNTGWPEKIKRTVIAQSIEVHRRKGTIGALRRTGAWYPCQRVVSVWWPALSLPPQYRADRPGPQ